MPLKILVVDDDVTALEMARQVLSSLGPEVVAFNDSRKASSVASKEKFDVLMLDVRMPHLNGWELAKRIRSSGPNMETPIIMVSGHAEAETMYESFSTGATYFANKPLDREGLSSLLSSVSSNFFPTRRQYSRVPLEVDVTCTIGGRTLRGCSWNVSQGGMQIEVDGLSMGDVVKLTFQLPKSIEDLQSLARVVWTKDERQGVHFMNMSLEHQERIREFVGGEQ